MCLEPHRRREFLLLFPKHILKVGVPYSLVHRHLVWNKVLAGVAMSSWGDNKGLPHQRGIPSQTPQRCRPRATPSQGDNRLGGTQSSSPHLTLKAPTQGGTPSGHCSSAASAPGFSGLPSADGGDQRQQQGPGWHTCARRLRPHTPSHTPARANEPTALLGRREPVVGRSRAVTQH